MSKKRKSNLISYVAIACFLSVTTTAELSAFSLSPPREGDRAVRRSERRRPERKQKQHKHPEQARPVKKDKRLDLLRESFEALLDTKEPKNRVSEDPRKEQITDSRFEPEREQIDRGLPSVDSEIQVFPNLSRLTKRSFLEFLAKEASLTPRYSDRYAGHETDKVIFHRVVASRLAKLVNDSFANRYQDRRSTFDDHIKGVTFEAEKERRSNVSLIKTRIKELSNPELHDKQSRALELIREDYEAEYGQYLSKEYHPEEGKVYFDPFVRLSVLDLVKNTKAEEKEDLSVKEHLARYTSDRAELRAENTNLDFSLPDISLAHIYEREFEPLLDVKGVVACELLQGKDLHKKLSSNKIYFSNLSLDEHKKHHLNEYVESERNLTLAMQPITKEWSFEPLDPSISYDHEVATNENFLSSNFQSYFTKQDLPFSFDDCFTEQVPLDQGKQHFNPQSHLEIAVVAYYALKHLDEAKLTKENLHKALQEQREELLAQLTTHDLYKSAKVIREHQFLLTDVEKENYTFLFTPREFEEPHFVMREHQAPFDRRQGLPFVNIFRDESLISKLEKDTSGKVDVEHFVYYTKGPKVFEAKKESSTIAVISKLGDLITYYGIELCEPVDFKEAEYGASYDMKQGEDLLTEYELLAKKIHKEKNEALVASLLNYTDGKVEALFEMATASSPLKIQPFEQEGHEISPQANIKELKTPFEKNKSSHVAFTETSKHGTFDLKEGECDLDLISKNSTLTRRQINSLVTTLFDTTKDKVKAFASFIAKGTPLALTPKEQRSHISAKSKISELKTTPAKSKKDPVSFKKEISDSHLASASSASFSKGESVFDAPNSTLIRKNTKSLVTTLFDTTKDGVKVFHESAKEHAIAIAPKPQTSSISAKAKLSKLDPGPDHSHKDAVAFNNKTAASGIEGTFKGEADVYNTPNSMLIRKNTKSLVTTLFDTTKDGVKIFHESAKGQAIAIAPKPQTSSISAKAKLSRLDPKPDHSQKDAVAFNSHAAASSIEGNFKGEADPFDAPNSSLLRKNTESLVTTLFETTKDGVKVFQDSAKEAAVALGPKPQSSSIATSAQLKELKTSVASEIQSEISFQEKGAHEIAALKKNEEISCYELSTKELARRKMQSLISYTYGATKEKLKNRFENVAKVVSLRKLIPTVEEGSLFASIRFNLLKTVYDTAIHMPKDFSEYQYPLACVYSEVKGEDFVKYQGLQFLSSNLVTLDKEEAIKELGFEHYFVEANVTESSAKSLQEDDTLDRDFVLGAFAFNELIFKKHSTKELDFSPVAYKQGPQKFGKEAEFLEYGKLYMERLADCGMDFAFNTVEGITRSVGKPKNLVAFENPKRYSFNPYYEKDFPETTWSYGIIADDFMIATTYEDYDFNDFYSLLSKVHFAFNSMYYPAPEMEMEKLYKVSDYYQFAFSSFLAEHSQNISTGVGDEVKLNNLACWKNPDFENTQFLAHENLFTPDIEGHSLIMDLAEQAKTSKLPQLLTQSEHLPSLINAATAFIPSVQNAISSNKNNRVIDENLHTLPTLDELNTTTFSSEFNADLEIIPNPKEDGYLFAITLDIENKKQFERPPQNFIFMVDRSGAIDRNRFQVFKQAVAKSLMYLKEGDTFNIVTFDSQVTPMSHDGVFFSASTKHGAKRFLESQKRSYKYALPDLYDVLLHANHLAKKSELPTTVFLLTNGKTLEEFDTQSEALSQILALNKDHFSLFTACASHSNNNLMLEILSNLNKGEFLHSQTHAAFPRKFAAFVKHASHLMANNIHVTAAKSDQNANLIFYPNETLASNLYIDKPYTIIGKIDRLSDFELIVQGKFGEQWLNLKKNISFKNAKKGGRYIYRDYGMHIAYSKYKEFLKEGNTVCLDEAKQVLKPLNIGSIY